MSISPTDLGWTAGIIDGEGCISLAVNRPRPTNRQKKCAWSVRIDVGNTNRGMLEALQRFWGGSVVEGHDYPYSKPRFHWVLTTRGARQLLPQILPHLRVKNRQAFVALLAADPASPPGSRGAAVTRHTAKMLMRRFNQRGEH